jgi:hypothetical protein
MSCGAIEEALRRTRTMPAMTDAASGASWSAMSYARRLVGVLSN